MTPAVLSYLRRIQRSYPEAIIAGGYVRDTFLGLTPKDIDIFISPPREQDFKAITERLVKTSKTYAGLEEMSLYLANAEVRYVFEGAERPDGLPVQIVALQPHLTPIDRVLHHDFGLCQAWHDGVESVASPAFYTDVMRRTVTLVHCESEGEFKRSMRRWKRLSEKLVRIGFEMVIPKKYLHYVKCPVHDIRSE